MQSNVMGPLFIEPFCLRFFFLGFAATAPLAPAAPWAPGWVVLSSSSVRLGGADTTREAETKTKRLYGYPPVLAFMVLIVALTDKIIQAKVNIRQVLWHTRKWKSKNEPPPAMAAAARLTKVTTERNPRISEKPGFPYSGLWTRRTSAVFQPGLHHRSAGRFRDGSIGTSTRRRRN